MTRTRGIRKTVFGLAHALAVAAAMAAAMAAATRAVADDLRIGLIGLDTSHAINFAKDFNDSSNPHRIPGARITAAFKGGSPDIVASISRVDGFTAEITSKYGVKLYDSIEGVARNVDAVMILSDDGRAHLAEARRLIPFHQPIFIDKPMTASLRDAVELFRLARQNGVPCFSSSGLRYSAGMAELKRAPIGRLLGAFAYSPAELEPHHPDLYWYGIHAVEALYTVMGRGCETVVRTSTPDTDVVTGVWSDGRVGTVRGTRNANHKYSLMVFGSKAIVEQQPGPDPDPLSVEILKFFRTGISPVPPAETIEILTFMTAADVSKQRGGVPVKLAEVLAANGGADGI